MKLEFLTAVLCSRIVATLCVKEGWPGKIVFGFIKRKHVLEKCRAVFLWVDLWATGQRVVGYKALD